MSNSMMIMGRGDRTLNSRPPHCISLIQICVNGGEVALYLSLTNRAKPYLSHDIFSPTITIIREHLHDGRRGSIPAGPGMPGMPPWKLGGSRTAVGTRCRFTDPVTARAAIAAVAVRREVDCRAAQQRQDVSNP